MTSAVWRIHGVTFYIGSIQIFIYLYILKTKKKLQTLMSHITIKWVLRAKNIRLYKIFV